MPWDSSTRRARLPSDWATRRLRVLRRDGYACQHRDDPHAPKCLAPASEVDHIERGDDHAEANLRAICTRHHKAKTQAEAIAARLRRRPPERHPGLID